MLEVVVENTGEKTERSQSTFLRKLYQEKSQEGLLEARFVILLQNPPLVPAASLSLSLSLVLCRRSRPGSFLLLNYNATSIAFAACARIAGDVDVFVIASE